MKPDFFETILRPHMSEVPDIEFLARQIVEGFIIGWHKSPYHGFSVEFAEHRLYNPGDNLKHVDWKVFGRNDKMFTKKYEEETNLRCYITIDQSNSMLFAGENQYHKLQTSIIYAGALMEMMSKQMDAFGLAFFEEDLNVITQTKTNTQHKREMIAHLESVWNKKIDAKKESTTYIAKSLHELAERAHKRSLIIVFTDFLDIVQDVNDIVDAIHHLKHNKHEVLFFMIGDKKMEWDFDMPSQALELIDLETNQSMKLHPNDYKDLYINKMSDFRTFWNEKMIELNVDFFEIDIAEHPSEILRAYLLKRMKMM